MSKLDNLLWKFLTGTWTNNHKLDELQKADMQGALAKVGLYTTCVLLPILTLAGVVYDGLHQQLSFSTLLLFVLLSIDLVILYLSVRKNNVFDMEVETQEEHAVALQRLKRQTMKKGVVFFVVMLLWNNVVMRLLFNAPPA